MAAKKNYRVTELVEAILEEDADASVQELYDRAKDAYGVDVSKLTLRQFNARYILPIKRGKGRSSAVENAAPAPKEEPAPRVPQNRPPAESDVRLEALPHAELVPWPHLNPRTRFDPADLEELAESIRDQGIRIPVAVKLNAEPPHYIYQGERRWRAAELAGLTWIPCLVTEDVDFRTAHSLAMTENMQRQSLTPLEEARGLQRELDMAKEAGEELTQEELGSRYGYGQAWVSNRLRLLQLPASMLALVDDGIVSPTAARDSLLPFTRLTDDGARGRFFEKVKKQLVAQAKKGPLPLPDDQIRSAVASVGRSLSRPLRAKGAPPSYTYDGQNNERGYVTAAEHKKACSCGGPAFDYEPYGQGRAARCFDLEWYAEANEQAGKEWEEERAAEREKRAKLEDASVQEALEELQLVQGTVYAPGDLPRGTYYTVWTKRRGAYPDVSIGLLEPAGFHAFDLYGDPAVVWVGPEEAFQIASDQGEEILRMTYLERQRKRGKADAKEADHRELDSDVVLWLIAELASNPYGRLSWGHISATLGDLGVDVDRLRGEGNADTASHVLTQLHPAKIEQLAKVLATRLQRGDFADWKYGKDPLEDEVLAELSAENLERLTKMLPFPLPDQPARGEGAHDAGDEEEEDDGEEEGGE